LRRSPDPLAAPWTFSFRFVTLFGTAGPFERRLNRRGWGGDEVVVCLRETDHERIEKLVDAIKTTVAKECSAQPVLAERQHLISVACGTYVFSERKSPTEIVEVADKRMYEDKAKMKAPG
jgi:Diguanylate cyclase, GGDEF domain